MAEQGKCPLTGQQIIDIYFIENRTKILDVAAFLDRLDRAADGNGKTDFRMRAFHMALQALCHESSERTLAIQMAFSDPTREPLKGLDQKSANGAYDHWKTEVV